MKDKKEKGSSKIYCRRDLRSKDQGKVSRQDHKKRGSIILQRLHLGRIKYMATSMKLENKLEGATNYRAWKKRIDLILAKHKVLDFVLWKVEEPTDDVGKEKYKEANILAMNLNCRWS